MSASASLWVPRHYQQPVLHAVANGTRFACLAWHRRAGKDLAMIHLAAHHAQRRVGLHLHMAPLANQSRRAYWLGRTKDGVSFMDSAFPRAIRKATHEADMRIELKNGSIFQLAGSDNYESLLSTNPVWITFSEYALSDPRAWQYLSPILMENDGVAVFISTPRGRNHFYKLMQAAKEDPAWFAQTLTVDDTGVMSAEALDMARKILADEGLFRQEYYCSFEAGDAATYYGGIIDKLEDDGKITHIPHDPKMLTDTAWDLGMDDQTGIWFLQKSPFDYRVIDYYASSGAGLDHYAQILKERPYTYGNHYLPHDAEVKELGTGRSRVEVLGSLGIRANVARRQGVADGIQAVRTILPKCAFDKEKCAEGLDHLRQYRRAYNPEAGTYSQHPLHDEHSHAADAFRTFATASRDPRPDDRPIPTQAILDPRDDPDFQAGLGYSPLEFGFQQGGYL